MNTAALKLIKKIELRNLAVRNFWQSPSFFQLLGKIEKHKSVNQDSVMYYPGEFDFTIEEFNLLCETIDYHLTPKIEKDEETGFITYEFLYRNFIFLLYLGQGSSWQVIVK